MNYKKSGRILGYSLMVVSIFMIIYQNVNVNAFVVLDNFISGGSFYFPIALFMVGALFVFVSGKKETETEGKRKLEEIVEGAEVGTISEKGGKINPNDNYYLKDKSGLITQKDNTITLRDYLSLIDTLKAEEGQTTLNQLKEVYTTSLERFVRGGGEKAIIAREFLRPLNPEALKSIEADNRNNEYVEREDGKEDYSDVRNALRQYNGSVDKDLRRVMNDYGFTYLDKHRDGAGHRVFSNGKLRVSLSSTPSDSRRGGLNEATKVIRIFRENGIEKRKSS